jgi:putative FmdB family regulatory protein
VTVPTYSYRCAACGPFDRVRPMAAADEEAVCPACAAPSRRTFAAPALRRLPAGVRAAVEAGERSAEAPEVTRSIPASGRRAPRVSTDPRHARLPRP